MDRSDTATLGGGNSSASIVGWLAVGFLALLPFLLDYTAVLRAAEVWFISPTYHHCPLVLLISGYCLWRQRARLMAQPLKPCWPALLLLPCLSLLWLIAVAVDIDEARQLLLVALAHGAVLSFAGTQMYRYLFFPLAYLVFAVPMGAFMVPYLQTVTTWFCTFGLGLLNIPYVAEGYLITLQSGAFEVAEACAGLRFLVATVAFSVLFGYLVTPKWRYRFLLFLLSLLIPIVINGMRAFALILIAHYSDHTMAVGVDHFVYGWGFFTVVLVALILVGLKFREPGYDPWKFEPGTMAPHFQASLPGRSLLIAAMVTAIGLAAGPAYAGYLQSLPLTINPLLTVDLNPAAPWQHRDAYVTWAPNQEGTAHYQHQHFSRDGRVLDVYQLGLAEGRNQLQRAAAATRFISEGNWIIGAHGKTNFSLFGNDVSAATAMLQGHSHTKLVYYWHILDGTLLADPTQARLAYLRARLLPGDRTLGLLMIATDIAGSLPATQQAVRRFILDTPELRRAFISPSTL